jgi:hypothetical protein
MMNVPLLTLSFLAAFIPLIGGAPSAPAHAAVERFYARMLGDWVGTCATRLQGEEPATTYFHLTVTRPDPRTYREEFRFFRRGSNSGSLTPSGTQTSRALLEPDGRIRCEAEAMGTVLIGLKERKQSWQTEGSGWCDGPDHFVAETTGRISVDGTPLGVGKRGRIRSARATWDLQGGNLIGRTEVESRFQALFVTRGYRVVIEMRAERGRDLRAYVARAVGERAAN